MVVKENSVHEERNRLNYVQDFNHTRKVLLKSSSESEDESSDAIDIINKKHQAYLNKQVISQKCNKVCTFCNQLVCQCFQKDGCSFNNDVKNSCSSSLEQNSRPKLIPKRRVNNVWGSMLQEEILENTIKKVGVDEIVLFTKKSDRGAESYDFTKASECKRSVTSDELVEEINKEKSSKGSSETELDLCETERFGKDHLNKKRSREGDDYSSDENDRSIKHRKKHRTKKATVLSRLGNQNHQCNNEHEVTPISPLDEIVTEIMRNLREPSDKKDLFGL